ncbi:MAG: hypothetical protein FWF22_05310 [Treponema sp.]|nr:hypothetical protein [Treponema sp.]
MKYFICRLGGFIIGIPADQTEHIAPAARTQENISERENGKTYISVPALMRQTDLSAPHALMLKAKTPPPDSGQIVLLTPKIIIDLEIQDEKISRLPGVFAGVYSFFSGACFTEDGLNLILLINPQKLQEKYND